MTKNIFFALLLCPLLLLGIPFSSTRAPCHPFISGDAFRAYCDHVFDETDTSIDPKRVSPYETVFVKTDYLGTFFSQIHPHIQHPYILVSHNSDDPAPGPFGDFIQDEKIVAWFAQNVDDNTYPKLHPIPIGIANRYCQHGQGPVIRQVQSQHLLKRHLLYLNFAIGTFPAERQLAYDLLSGAHYIYCSPPKNFSSYLSEVAACQFVASPRGNGLDTHRFWESLYLGSYPIVKSCPLDPLYNDLPVVIIQDWHEVTEDFLNQKYQELTSQSFNLDKLYIPYWIDLINSYKSQNTL